jgi:SulP family sulfate permease
MVGEIPKTIIHSARLTFGELLNIQYDVIIIPAVSIALLCMLESLLCGVVAGKMTGEKLKRDRELIALGIGNFALPFLGGIPAAAAIVRTSLAIKAGGKTRMASIIKGFIILLAMITLGPFMSKIPLSALAGALMVIVWRMNDWENIRYMFGKRFWDDVVKYLITLFCTVIFGLSIAIAAGCLLSMLLYVVRVSDVDISIRDFEPERADTKYKSLRNVQVVYITGSVFFGSSDLFLDKIYKTTAHTLVISLRGVPDVDTAGARDLLEYFEERTNAGVQVVFCGVQSKVKAIFDRVGITDAVGERNFFWKVEDAIQWLDDMVMTFRLV